MEIEIVEGDLLKQHLEVIVNSWNRNIIPWWLLLPQGVSGAIKKYGGHAPFEELGRLGPIPLGEARETCAGKLAYKAIIHVAGINMLWFATEYSVNQSVISAMGIVNQQGYKSVAFPLIGSGSGNRGKMWSLKIMQETFYSLNSVSKVIVVKYMPQ